MITVYLCGLSVIFAMAIGLPIGIWVSERERLWTVTRVGDRHAADPAVVSSI
jgi:glycine betaine/proline transport system permease protein